MDNKNSHETEPESSVNKNQTLNEHVAPLVDTVLSFVAHGLNSGTLDNVLKVASGIFTVLEVRQFFLIKLLEHCGLDDLPIRNNTQLRTGCSVLMTDTIAKFQHPDETGAVSFLCCDEAGISRIPKFQIEEVNDIAMVDRS